MESTISPLDLTPGEVLFKTLCGPRFLDKRRQELVLQLPDEVREQHLRWLSGQLWSCYVRFRYVPHLAITKEQYGAVYAYYIQVRHLLGPLQMKLRVWDQLKRTDLAHWRWFTELRRARYRDRRKKSPEGIAAMREASRKYNASEKGKERRRKYRKAQTKGFFQ